MALGSGHRWAAVERWTPTLFIVGSVLELVFALDNGAAYLLDGVTSFEWIYPGVLLGRLAVLLGRLAVLLGRLAVLLGLAGLSVRLVERRSRSGKPGRVLLAGALLFTVGLVSLSIRDVLGVSTPVIAVFAIGTVVLTILSFILFGVAGFRTEAYPAVVGGLMLVATVGVLSVLLTSGTFPTTLRGRSVKG